MYPIVILALGLTAWGLGLTALFLRRRSGLVQWCSMGSLACCAALLVHGGVRIGLLCGQRRHFCHFGHGRYVSALLGRTVVGNAGVKRRHTVFPCVERRCGGRLTIL